MASTATTSPPGGAANFWLWSALAVSLFATGGSLFLSLGMNLQACPLCFYQRTFAMSLVAVLAIGQLLRTTRLIRLSLLALPLAVAGLGVAAFHVWLEVNGTLECPEGVLGLGTAPQQSLSMFALIVVLLLADLFARPKMAVNEWTALFGGVCLGLLLSLGSATSNPPMKKPPPEVYKTPPVICRPPLGPE
jgi:disulfide bond formation protein DsbB